MKLKSVLLLTAVALCATSITWSCKKDTTYVPQLPPETTTGQNTFGCLVNGQVWRNGGVGFPHYSLAINTLEDSTLIIEALRNNNESNEDFTFYITSNKISEEKYQLDSSNVFMYYSYTNNDNHNSCDYQRWGNGFIQLTKVDLINGIVSGRFEATLFNSNCDSIVITQGRFDLKQ